MDEKRSYTVNELQSILGISRTSVYKLLHEHRFKWQLIGVEYRISKKSFDKWFDGDEEDEE